MLPESQAYKTVYTTNYFSEDLSRIGILHAFLRFWNLALAEKLCIATFEYFRILYFNYHEVLFGIWNLCQKTVGFRILYRNLVGVGPLAIDSF